MTPDSLKQARAKEAVSGEYLDEWRAEEADRLWRASINLSKRTNWSRDEISVIAARLAREGVMPPEPINPDLIEARECCAMVAEGLLGRETAGGYRYGDYDASLSVQSTLLAIERAKGREVGS